MSTRGFDRPAAQWPDRSQNPDWVWFAPNIEALLTARRLAYQAISLYPTCSQVVIGSTDAAPLFELAPIPLRCVALPAQVVLPATWLQRRSFIKAVREHLTGRSIFATVEADLQQDLRNSMARLTRCIDQAEGLPVSDSNVPTLEAGASSLAASTHYYRSLPPNALKLTVILDAQTVSKSVQASLDWVSDAMPPQEELASRLKLTLCVTVMVIGHLDPLGWRSLRKLFPTATSAGLSDALGHIAYADRVISNASLITRMVLEMGRKDALVL